MGRKSIVIKLSINEREFLERLTRDRILLLKAEGHTINEMTEATGSMTVISRDSLTTFLTRN